jgi:hypothetical protein
MSGHIEYKGKFLGRIHPQSGGHFILSLENVDALETLFKLEPSDQLILNEGQTNMSYGQLDNLKKKFLIRQVQFIHQRKLM